MGLDELLALWDKVDHSCDLVACALPAQMTEAADHLERNRKEFRKAVFMYVRSVEGVK